MRFIVELFFFFPRLFKYSKRGFAVAVPDLDKSRVNQRLLGPTATPSQFQGLAKLLVYDHRLSNPVPFYGYPYHDTQLFSASALPKLKHITRPDAAERPESRRMKPSPTTTATSSSPGDPGSRPRPSSTSTLRRPFAHHWPPFCGRSFGFGAQLALYPD